MPAPEAFTASTTAARLPLPVSTSTRLALPRRSPPAKEALMVPLAPARAWLIPEPALVTVMAAPPSTDTAPLVPAVAGPARSSVSAAPAPPVNPAPGVSPAKPGRSAPLDSSSGPLATTTDVDATVPVVATEPARDSCVTVKLSEPVLAAAVAVAVTLVLDDVAFIALQSA